jgi:hypothetical protein
MYLESAGGEMSNTKSAMVYANTSLGQRLTVYQNGKRVEALAAFNPVTGEAIQYMIPDSVSDFTLKLIYKILRWDCWRNPFGPTRHYFLRNFTTTIDEESSYYE